MNKCSQNRIKPNKIKWNCRGNPEPERNRYEISEKCSQMEKGGWDLDMRRRRGKQMNMNKPRPVCLPSPPHHGPSSLEPLVGPIHYWRTPEKHKTWISLLLAHPPFPECLWRSVTTAVLTVTHTSHCSGILFSLKWPLNLFTIMD